MVHAESLRLPLVFKAPLLHVPSPKRDSALLGVSSKYLHTLSKTDPVKLLMVTSTSSTGKKNEVQMEVAQLAMGDLELSMYCLKPQSPHLWLGTAPAS